MTNFHAVFLDETGCEFGATIEAETKDEAWAKAAEDYPESSCVQLESPQDAAEREARMYERIQAEEDGDFSQWAYEQEFGE